MINEQKRHGMSTAAVLLSAVFISASAWAADAAIQSTLLDPVLKRLNAAATARMNVMVPDSYDRAEKYYQRAKEKLEKGKTLKSVEDDLAEASEALGSLEGKSAQAELTLKKGMAARDDALAVKGNEINPKAWGKAESHFRKAASILERGNIKSAESRLGDSIELYRAIELAAIKTNYLADTAKLIVAAKDDRVDRYAPKTVAKAEQLLTEASSSLSTDRYDSDRPRSLARDSDYEARHARYIGKEAEAIDDDDKTVEDLLLEWEQPFRQMAGELDIVIDQSNGYSKPTEDILTAIQYLKDEIRDLGLQLNDKDQQIVLLQGKAAEGADLAEQIKRQDARRAQFANIEQLFAPGEARVSRQGDNITLRLIGLSFDSGKAVINSDAFSLLSKVQQAVNIFPQSAIDIEGHTDSFGGDDANLVLSQERAESVRAYLLANMQQLNPVNVNAYGYGEGKPIANNESQEGRARNRRIDLVIKPN
ncbi:MAG: OmpA family protein [Pseudomonadales bacterium]